MKIFILDKDPMQTAQMLDDQTLNKQIKAIAQTLCNMHHYFNNKNVPLLEKDFHKQTQVIYRQWVRTCRANYLKLVDMGLACCYEYIFRFHPCGVVDIEFPIQSYRIKELVWGDKIKEIEHKLQPVIEFARDNVPDLPLAWNDNGSNNDKECSPFPLLMPSKYIEYLSSTVREGNLKPIDVYQSYRNYYSAFLHTTKEPMWTRREKPYWIEL